MVWQGAELTERCERLGELIADSERWWRPRAFHHLTLPWEHEIPALASALRALTLAQAEQLATDNTALAHWFTPWFPVAAELATQCEPGALPAAASGPWPEPRDVPGRKWAQLRAFVDALPHTGLPALEWCAGKGHLARHYAARRGAAVTGLEWNPELAAAGNQLAAREQLPVCLQVADVLAPATAGRLAADQQVLALHACGDLHLQLLHACAGQRPAALALAPCCYHLTRDSHYRPLSPTGRRHDPALARADLHTAVQESITSPPRVQAQRRRLQAWRLGFDLLQRELRGEDAYLPTPSLPLSVLGDGFPAFCRRIAAAKGLVLPVALDVIRFEAAGAERLREVTALDLPRLLFRRALESWLVLDRAGYLSAAGFTVRIGTFCERRLTPRNLLLLAQRAG